MGGLLVLLVFGCLYMLPTIVAFNRGRDGRTEKHRNIGGIAVLNFFLGWTLVGWVIALVWAMQNPPPAQIVHVAASNTGSTAAPVDLASRLHKIADMRDRGLLTDAEFESAKRKLLLADDT